MSDADTSHVELKDETGGHAPPIGGDATVPSETTPTSATRLARNVDAEGSTAVNLDMDASITTVKSELAGEASTSTAQPPANGSAEPPSPPKKPMSEMTEDELRLHSYDDYADPLAVTILKKTASMSQKMVKTSAAAVTSGVNMIVPNVVKSGVSTVVGGTTHGVTAAKDAVVGVIPTQIQNAAAATTGLVVNVASATTGMVVKGTMATGEMVGNAAASAGSLIAKAPEAVINTVIPDKLMSKATKRLVFVDFNDTLRSFFHTNILTIPYIFNETGVVVGCALILTIAFLSEYQTEIFFFAKSHLDDPSKVVVYGDVPKLMWGDWYPTLNVLHGVIHLIGFLIFASHNAQPVLLALGVPKSNVYLLGLIIPIAISFPMLFTKKAMHQKPLGVIANTFVGVSCVIMMFAFPFTGVGYIIGPERPDRIAVSLGVAVYAFTGIGSAVPVERTMDPKKYIRLLRVAVSGAVTLMVAFGISAYVSYGQNTCSVITLSLGNGKTKLVVSTFLLIASIAIIPMQLFPFAEVIDRRFLGLRMLLPYWHTRANIMRICVMALSAAVAWLVPFYGLVASIAGAFTCSVLGLIVPAFLDWTARKKTGLPMGKFVWFRIILMATFGFTAFVVGTGLTLFDIVHRLTQKQYHPPENQGNLTSPCY